MPLGLRAQKYSMDEINRNILECNGKKRLVKFGNDISVIVYRYPRYKYGLDDDFCSEFYLFFYHTMNRIILTYRDNGSTFAAYLFSTLRWQLNKFLGMQKRKSIDFEFVKNFTIVEDKLYTFDPEIEKVERNRENEKSRICLNEMGEKMGDRTTRGSVLTNRILLYIFRFWYKFSDEDISGVSEVLDCERDWLAGKIDQIRKRMRMKLDKKRKIEERRNVAFYKLSWAYKRLEALKKDGFAYAAGTLEREELERKRKRLLDRIDRLKGIMDSAVIKISNLKLSPSHRLLSEILGIPKGTIDTSNYVLEKDINRYINFWEESKKTLCKSILK